MAFEEQMKELQELTKKLEEGNLPLEEAVTLYTKGMQLAAACQKELETAKLTIEMQPVSLTDQEEKDNGNDT